MARRLAAALEEAIAEAAARERIRIRVKGTCNEDVLIEVDDVTLEDDPKASGRGKINGSVFVDGGSRAIVRKLIIQNANSDGVRFINGGARLD